MKKTLLTFATLAMTLISAGAFAKGAATVCSYDTGSKYAYSEVGNKLRVRYFTGGSSGYNVDYDIIHKGQAYGKFDTARLVLRGTETRDIVDGTLYVIDVPNKPDAEIGIFQINDGSTLVVEFQRTQAFASDSKACLR